MQLCAEHIAAIRAEVERLGMSHLNSNDPADTAQRIITSAEEHIPRVDPVRSIQALLLRRGIELLGFMATLVYPDDESLKHNDGHVCPLCEFHRQFQTHVNKECPDPECLAPDVAPTDTPWDVTMLANAADRVLQDAREQGLMPTGPLQ
jgi:hypothetical protein